MGTILEYAKLSAYVYGGSDPHTLPSGWAPMLLPNAQPVQSWGPTGYYGALFRNSSTGEVALVSRGMELGDAGDRRSVLALLNGNVPSQLAEARLFLDLVTQEYGIPVAAMTFAGHSLGGSLSQILSVETHRPAVTFNAVPVKSALPKLGYDPDGSYPITDVVDDGDPTMLLGPRMGTEIRLPASQFPLPGTAFPRPDPGGAAGADLILLGMSVLSAHRIMNVAAKLEAARGLGCPLVLDLDGDGVETTGVGAGAYFDHDGDGFAERTGWAGRDDGLLVWDRNGNGSIDSGRELFGNHTRLGNGQEASNGFQALADLDGNGDGRVDQSDAGFSALRIWKDVDGDGRSQPAELSTLAQMGVQSISVSSSPSSLIDGQGNEHRQVGTLTRTGGETGAVADVWFQSDLLHTIAAEWLPIPARIAALPEAAGYGRVRDLRQAAARDGVLESLVAEFVSQTDPSARDAILERILFRWTGSEAIDPASRGGNIDARRLAVVEQFVGQPFVGGAGANPNGPAGQALDGAYRDLAELVYAELMIPTHLKGLYGLATYSWDEAAQTMRADLSGVIAELDRQLAADPQGTETVLGEFARTLRGLQAEAIFDYPSFYSHFAERSQALAWVMTAAGRSSVEGTPGADVLDGGNGHEAVRGDGGDDRVSGGPGDDVLWGESGSDALTGGPGSDVLVGGSGDDRLDGGEGNDIYVFGGGAGHDVIEDTDWRVPNLDAVAVDKGVAPADVRVLRADNDLVLRIVGTGDEVRLTGWFLEGFGSDYQVQQVQFADGTIWDVPTLKRMATQGTSGPDVLIGYGAEDVISGLEGNDRVYGSGGNDTVEGGPGEDSVSGDAGDDLVRGGPDVDQLSGGDGNDTLDGGPGNDVLEGGFGNDTYLFGRGQGQDVIVDRDWQIANTDRILVATDVAPSHVTVQRVEYDLVLRITGTADEVRLSGWFLEGFGADYQVQRVEFADGTVWDVAALQRMVTCGTPGPDLLIGYGSADVIAGLEGDDRVYGGGGNDTVDGGPGADWVSGDGGDDLVRGGPDADQVQGGDGNDTVDGGPGNDVLEGGFGNDAYLFGRGQGQDVIVDRDWQIANTDRILVAAGVTPAQMTVERADYDLVLRITGTTDEVRLSGWFLEGFGADYQVQRVDFADGTTWDVARLKQLALAVQGTSGRDTLLGTSAADVMRGLDGDDVLYGRDGDDLLDGGSGADVLSGEAGNDTYVVDDPGDMVAEGPGQGVDSVQSSVTFTLGANVENLTLTGPASIGGTGNGLGNVLTGNAGANTLDGGGGADTLTGGGGDDTYVVDDLGDRVMEAPGEGSDTVRSSISYALPANVENLTLTGIAGLSGTGNALDNVLTGNSGANVLAGGAGNDTYVVDQPNDVVTEGSQQGTDTVRSVVTYTLPANVENLTLSGTGAINGTGNSLPNVLAGNSAANLLAGGTGGDTYLFGRGVGQDTISDFDQMPNTDVLLCSAGIRPLDLVVSRGTNDLRVAIHGAPDSVTVRGWYGWYGGSMQQLEIIQAGDGSRLSNGRVALLVQDMASYSARTGLTWDQAIDARPAEVQAILAAHWLPPA